MRKHCIFEHFLRFVKQIRPKLWVIVTLHVKLVRVLLRRLHVDHQEVLSSLVRHFTVKAEAGFHKMVFSYCKTR